MENEYRSEILLALAIIEGYLTSKKNPKYVSNAVELYLDARGDVKVSDAIERLKTYLHA